MPQNPPSPKELHVLVADDERLARKRLVDLLRKDADIEEISEADNGIAAVSAIQERHPDMVFLDIQMPGLDGFGVIDALSGSQMPLTVFVTAHDQYAIKAFEADASDYLLKPFSDERFEKALARAKGRLRAGTETIGPNVSQLASDRSDSRKSLDWLVVKSAGFTQFVMAADIDWIQAAGVYVALHVQGKELIYRSALGDLAEKLDPSKFVRIHRSTIVNIHSIKQLEPMSHGEFEVILKDGSRVHLSRNYRAELERRLGQSL